MKNRKSNGTFNQCFKGTWKSEFQMNFKFEIQKWTLKLKSKSHFKIESLKVTLQIEIKKGTLKSEI